MNWQSVDNGECIGVGRNAMLGLRIRIAGSTNIDLAKSKQCVLWAGAKSDWGYGRIGALSMDGKHRTFGVHRISYLVFRGPIPAGMLVCHSCDTPSCYNPNHLFLGSPSKNIQDSYDKRRQQYRPPYDTIPRLYYEILADWKPYEVTRKMLASKYGVPLTHVNYVIKRAHRHGELQHAPLRAS